MARHTTEYFNGYKVEKVHSTEELNSNLYALFHRVFGVRVTYIDLMDYNEISTYGHVSSGDPDEDTRNANSKVLVALTIPQMVEMFKNNIPLYFVDESDEHAMYDIIARHIYEWTLFANNTVNLKTVPYEDLKDLSDFATAIFSTRDREKDAINDNMNQLHKQFGQIDDGLPSAMDIIGVPKNQVHQVQTPKQEKIPHLVDSQTLGDIFSASRGFGSTHRLK